MTRVTKIRLVSLGTLANVSEYGLMVLILDFVDQYLFNMHVEFNCIELFNTLISTVKQLNSCAWNLR